MSFGFFTNGQNWQYWHYCQLCIPIYCSFLLYLQHMVLVNMKLDISGCSRITFQGCRLHWPSSFLMAQLKLSWQYWHFCIVVSEKPYCSRGFSLLHLDEQNCDCAEFVHRDSRWPISFESSWQKVEILFASSVYLRQHFQWTNAMFFSKKLTTYIDSFIQWRSRAHRGAVSHQRRIMRLCHSTPVLISTLAFTDPNHSAFKPNTPKVRSTVHVNCHFLFFFWWRKMYIWENFESAKEYCERWWLPIQ